MPSPRHRRARGGPPLPATRVGCSEGSGSALRPAWKGVAVDPPGLREWSSHSEPPWGWGGHTRSPTGVGRGQGPQGPQAAQPGWAAGAPVGPRRALSAAARLWEGASPGTRWRGKGGIAGARHAERPRSACIAAGGGVAAPATPRAPPRPRSGRWPTPPPASPRPSVPAASLWRRQPAPHSAEPRPQQLQKMAAKAAPVATLPRAGGGRRSPPAAPLPFPRQGTLRPGAGTLAGTGGAGAGAGASEEGEGRLPAGRGDAGWGVAGGQCREDALGLPPSLHAPSPHEVAAPGWGNANGLLTSVTACRPHPCRYPRPHPHPHPGGAAGLARLDAPRRKMKIKLKAVCVPTIKRPKPGTPRRRSGWILRRHELQRRR